MHGPSEAYRLSIPRNRSLSGGSIHRFCLALLGALSISLPAGAYAQPDPQRVELAGHAIGHADGTIVLPLRRGSPTQLTLDDARSLDVHTVSLIRSPSPAASWLDAPDLRTDSDAPPTHAIAFAPPDATGQDVLVGSQRIDIVWLTPPIDAAALATPIRPDALASAGFQALLTPLSHSPLQRWRARLALGRLAQPTGAPRDADTHVELLARSIERRWIAALGRLHAADPDLAASVRAALICDIDFGAGRFVPVTRATPEDERRLLADLLNPTLDDPMLADRARLWLSALPSVRSWLIDAAGQGTDAEDNPIASVGVVNLRQTPLSVRLPAAAGDPSLSLREIPPRSALGVRTPIDTQAAPDSLVELVPPGADMIGFHPPHTCASWLYSTPGAAMPPIAARLDRTPEGDWRLYIELRPIAADEPFRVVLHHGLAADSRSATITPEGAVPAGGPLAVNVIEHTHNAWRAIVTIPPAWIEPGGTLRLGVELVRADDTRWTWPRRILPWQTTRPRAAFDLSAWDRLPDPPIDPLRRRAPEPRAAPGP